MYKYVCAVEYYPNCRVHDCGFYSRLEFFKSLRELMQGALQDKDEYEYCEIYNRRGKCGFQIGYEYSNHSVSGLSLKVKGLKFRTIDDGSGKLIWANS